MTEAEHLENMEFIRQASEKAKVARVLEEIKAEIIEEWGDVCAKEHGCLNGILEIIDKHMVQQKRYNMDKYIDNNMPIEIVLLIKA